MPNDPKVLSSRPTVVDLFAGAGLFSLAFQRAGFRPVQAYERDPVAAATYARNLGHHVSQVDLHTVRPAGQCDVLIAGPPCQGFSSLGSRNQDDPRNFLALLVPKWAKVLNPQVVVVENVERFAGTAVWSQVARLLRRQGYAVETWTLDAADYSVPQLRRRSFTIAHRNPISLPTRRSVSKRVSVAAAWEGLTRKPDGKNQHQAPIPSELALSRMRVIPPGGDKRDVMKRAPALAPESWFSVGCHATDVWGRMHWDRPCNTLRTCLLNPSKGRYIHPEQHRTISLREAARLQTVPDTFGFEGTPYQVARQIGNGVPVKLGGAVARAVAKSLR